MERNTYLDTIRREVDELARLAEGNLDVAVPACPEWTMADLTYHVGEVLDFWGWIAATEAKDPSDYEDPPRPDDTEVVTWLQGQRAEILDVLSKADEATPVWSWASDNATMAWISRRMAHETAVHRWDGAASLSPTPAPIDAELATDGIDEFLQYFTDRVKAEHPAMGGTAHLHCTDVEGEWLVSEPDPQGPLKFSREHARGDVAVRGAASDLLLALWVRIPLDDRFEVFGDRGVAEHLIGRSRLE